MQYAVFCILLLAISEPLPLHAKKVVVVVPRQIRRSPIPWRPSSTHYRKTSRGGELYQPIYHSHSNHYHSKRPLHKGPPFPHGGDDFDQGHEHVNHVHIPYGKDVTHGMSFGKGYVPYENIKGSFSFGHERHTGSQGYKHAEPDYAQTSFTSTGSEYHSPEYSYDTSQSDSYFSDGEDSQDYRERRNDRKKFYTSRSIEKDLGANTHVDLSTVINKGKQELFHPKATSLFKGTSPQTHALEGAIVLPGGIPPATIGGSKDGIVLRDTVALDDYQKKLDEITKSWPHFLTNGAANQGTAFQHQQVNVTPRFSAAGLPGSSFTGSPSWLPEFAQSKQGYAVKEDTMEPPHDFRMIPVQTAPFQSLNLGTNVGITPITQTVHG